MIKISLRCLAAHKRRLAATCSAVLLGIAFLAGTLVLGDSLRAGFGDTFAQANAGTDAVVRGVATVDAGELAPRRPLDPSLLDELRAVDGVAAAQPTIDGTAQLSGADGSPIGGDGPPTLATNWIDNAELNPFRIAEGRGPEAPGEVVIDRASAKAGDLVVGDTTVVRTPESTEVRIVGIATFGTADGMGAGFTFFALADARDHLLGGGRPAEFRPARCPTRCERRCPSRPGPPPLGRRRRGAQRYRPGRRADRGHQWRLPRHLRDLPPGLHRHRPVGGHLQHLQHLLDHPGPAEPGVRPAASDRRVPGPGVGIDRHRGNRGRRVGVGHRGDRRHRSGRRSTGPYGCSRARSPHLRTGGGCRQRGNRRGHRSRRHPGGQPGPGDPGVAGCPSRRPQRGCGGPQRVLPGTSHRRRDHPGRRYRPRARSRSGRHSFAGPGRPRGPCHHRGGRGARSGGRRLSASRVLGSPLPALSGVSGELARQNAQRDPKRTAGTASALMVGVGVVTLFTVFGASIKSTIDESVARSFITDLVITADGVSGSGLAPGLASEVAELPGVGTAAGLGYGAERIDGQDGAFSVADPSRLAGVLDLGVSAGSVEGLGDGELGVSEAAAEEKGWQLGTSVPVDFPDGTSTELTVAAICELTDNVGPFLMPVSVWAPHGTQPADTAVLIDVAAGADLAEVKVSITQIAEDYGAPVVQDRQEYIASVAGSVDQLLTVVYVLLALSIIIALMSIGNTLSLSIHQRTRELGLLRAVGQTRGQLRSMVRWESVLIATFGTLGGVGLGLFLSWGLVRVATAEAGFGSFALPLGQLGVVLVVGALVGILAGLRPARRAARLDVLGAIGRMTPSAGRSDRAAGRYTRGARRTWTRIPRRRA